MTLSLLETMEGRRIPSRVRQFLERYEIARFRQPKRSNCIGAVFFLGGIDPEEIFREPGPIELYSSKIIRVPFLEQADIVGIVNKPYCSWVEHLAIIHPIDRLKVIHREMEGAVVTTMPIKSLLALAAASYYICQYYKIK